MMSFHQDRTWKNIPVDTLVSLWREAVMVAKPPEVLMRLPELLQDQAGH